MDIRSHRLSCCLVLHAYGKPVTVLNESVQCFLDQDCPGDKQLVIYNSCSNASTAGRSARPS